MNSKGWRWHQMMTVVKHTSRCMVGTAIIVSGDNNITNKFYDNNQVLALNIEYNVNMIGISFSVGKSNCNNDSTTVQLSYQMIMTKFKQTTKQHPFFIMRMIHMMIHVMIRIIILAIMMIHFPWNTIIDAATMNSCS